MPKKLTLTRQSGKALRHRLQRGRQRDSDGLAERLRHHAHARECIIRLLNGAQVRCVELQAKPLQFFSRLPDAIAAIHERKRHLAGPNTEFPQEIGRLTRVQAGILNSIGKCGEALIGIHAL